jgi:Uma2 family endonuclease
LEKLDDGIRYELIDGIPYIKYEGTVNGVPCAMAAPASGHQAILGEIYRRLANFLEGRKCKVFPAPYAVLLDANDDFEGDIMLEPDITLVCDSSKRHSKGCKGVPDMVIEILSPTTRKKDKIIKKAKYEQYGVPEYWIVDPETKMVDVYLLFNGKYMISSYTDEDTLSVAMLQGCEINLKDVFDAAEA